MNKSENGSPYTTKVAPTPRLRQGDVVNQIRTGKEEEAFAKSTGIMPYPLEHLTPLLTDAFTALSSARKLLAQAIQAPDADKEAIRKSSEIIDKINKAILDLPETLGKIEL